MAPREVPTGRSKVAANGAATRGGGRMVVLPPRNGVPEVDASPQGSTTKGGLAGGEVVESKRTRKANENVAGIDARRPHQNASGKLSVEVGQATCTKSVGHGRRRRVVTVGVSDAGERVVSSSSHLPIMRESCNVEGYSTCEFERVRGGEAAFPKGERAGATRRAMPIEVCTASIEKWKEKGKRTSPRTEDDSTRTARRLEWSSLVAQGRKHTK